MKGFMERNKIYFDVLSSVIFGFAALLVSIASYRVSEQQLELTENESRPHFSVASYNVLNKKTNKYDNEILLINNLNGFGYNIHCKTYSLIEVKFPKGNSIKDVFVPLDGYYFLYQQTNPSIGTLFTLSGNLNNAHYADLYREFITERVKQRYGLVDINLKTLVAIDYQDDAETVHKVYFLDKEEIPERAALEYTKYYKSALPLDIDTITADNLMKEANNLSSD